MPTLSDLMSLSWAMMASREPWASVLRMSRRDFRSEPFMSAKRLSREARLGAASLPARCSLVRSSLSFLASRSLSISTSSSPTLGMVENPVTSTGVAGPASLTGRPWSSSMLFTLP